MDFLKSLLADPVKALKIAGIALVALLVLVFGLQLVGSSFKSLSGGVDGMRGISVSTAPSHGGPGYGADYDVGNYAREEMALSAQMPQLSARNVAGTVIYPPQPGSPAGDTAEEFEVTQYSANIETRKLEETCAAFDELKARTDVIFENANSYDRGCSYTFKVKHESVEEVLAWLKNFDPKELSENTYTVKQQIDDFTNEVEVLEKKRASIDETLEKAIEAYDDITTLATRTQNADALAQVINSKIAIIERLTQERININEQLDRLARAKADQLDRLEYTYFNVSVYENKFVDGEQLGDSWKEALRNFVRDVNKVVQDLTVNLILLLFLLAQWAIYAVIVLFVAKYSWKIAKYIWYR